jgi:methylated-DNA-[protein]-cysteine S-methyltransferase
MKKQADEPQATRVSRVETPYGAMTLVQCDKALAALRLNGEVYAEETIEETPLLQKAKQELTEYFAGNRRNFDLPLAPEGTAFQKRIWQTLSDTVPYGQTVTYGELAARCGSPKAARAVGQANHVNPLPIFIPCHRVIGAGGKLTGYGGGLPLKEALLKLESGK